MADYEIPDSPIFRGTMRKLEPKDSNHADTFNVPYSTLLENDNCLMKKLERIENKLNQVNKITNAEIDSIYDDTAVEEDESGFIEEDMVAESITSTEIDDVLNS